eukprot:scaffold117769_cov63-Phaeocystis_antarctica.AAC.2
MPAYLNRTYSASSASSKRRAGESTAAKRVARRRRGCSGFPASAGSFGLIVTDDEWPALEPGASVPCSSIELAVRRPTLDINFMSAAQTCHRALY